VRRLTVSADGQLFQVDDLEIKARGRRAVLVDDLPVSTEVVEAELVGQDVLALDDRAWAIHRSRDPVSVALVTDGNLFIGTAFALLPGLEVTTWTPLEYESAFGRGATPTTSTDGEHAAAELTVFDAYVPLTATLSVGNVLFIAPPRSTDHFTVTGSVEQPVPRAMVDEDPLLAHISFHEVGVMEAVQLVPREWLRTLVVGDVEQTPVPLLCAGQIDGRRLAVLAFDLHKSDLPLQLAFPLLMANLADWLAPEAKGDVPAQIAPGEVVALDVSPTAGEVTVTRPDGQVSTLQRKDGRTLFADTEQLGVYGLSWEGGQERVAVSLFSPQESDVRPRGSLPLSGGEASSQEVRPQQARREWWRPIGYVALVCLTVEWLYYHRSSVARIGGWMRRRAAKAGDGT
jgi:hypothetical protein